MIDWLIEKGIGFVFKQVVAAPIRVFVKVGFLLRRSVEYKKLHIPELTRKSNLYISCIIGGTLLIGIVVLLVFGALYSIIVTLMALVVLMASYWNTEVDPELRRVQELREAQVQTTNPTSGRQRERKLQAAWLIGSGVALCAVAILVIFTDAKRKNDNNVVIPTASAAASSSNSEKLEEERKKAELRKSDAQKKREAEKRYKETGSSTAPPGSHVSSAARRWSFPYTFVEAYEINLPPTGYFETHIKVRPKDRLYFDFIDNTSGIVEVILGGQYWYINSPGQQCIGGSQTALPDKRKLLPVMDGQTVRLHGGSGLVRLRMEIWSE